MRCLIALAFAFFLLAATANAQTAEDRQAVDRIPQQFSEAWAQHDARALADLMAEDVDFVTVGASWLHTRRDFETYHARLFAGRFSASTFTPLEQRVQFLRPDIAVLRWSWRMEGDLNFDNTPRPPRAGLLTMVVEKRDGRWEVVASQNTNAGPGTAPENEGLEFPIRMPRLGG